MSSITYVSAFYDLGRDKWKTFPRTFEEYLKGFRPFIEMFSQPPEEIGMYNMVLFIDSKHIETLRKEIHPHTKITLIPIDSQFLWDNLPMWRTLSIEKYIMETQRFKNIVAHRSMCPECYIPEYTLINHCKIDYICHLIDKCALYKVSPSDYYCWVDFGYNMLPERIPERMLDPQKLDPNKVNYTLINPITQSDRDILQTMSHALEKVGGFFFCGSSYILKQYQTLYHQVLTYYQNVLGLADDDQALVLACFFHRPDMFAMHYTGKWHEALVHFQKDVK
ncbi:hypothetical protein N9189_02045 [Pirellulaceae bacterium]|nr:hypothetical protein [Pirellulaceae bacterium]